MIWFTAMTGIVAGSAILYLIRRDHLAVHHGAWWITAGFSMLGLGLFPPLVNGFAKLIGVTYAPIVAVLIAFVALLIKTLLSDIDASKGEVERHRLVQRIALLEARIQDLESQQLER
jgi:hypothetical protein